MVDHLDYSSNRNGGSLEVQPRFKCLKIAFHDSGLTSIFKTTCCRDSENPEVYQLSVPWKHDVTWRQRNTERNWYMTSYQTIPGPAAFPDFPEPWEGCQSHRSDRCQPLSQDRSWSHSGTNEEWASCGIHWDKWDFTAIQTPQLCRQPSQGHLSWHCHTQPTLNVKPAKWTQNTFIPSPLHFHTTPELLTWISFHPDL